MVTALLLSGGTGTRMGVETPKQYIEVKGKPIIAYCMRMIFFHRGGERRGYGEGMDYRYMVSYYRGRDRNVLMRDGKRGMGAVLCTCPQPGMLRESVLQLPIWYV